MTTLHGEYRRHARTDIKTAISMSMDENGLNSRTHDVSESGLSIDKPSELNMALGQTVTVSFNRMPNFSVPAKVVRVSDHSIGLELDHYRFSEADINGIVKSAPLHERIRTNSKRAIWKLLRRTVMLLTNTVLRKPLIAMAKPTFLFAVYGNEKDVGTYFTPFMSKFMPSIMMAGVISNQGRRGLMVASKYFESELAQDSDKVRDYMQELKQTFPKIDYVALVGRLPNFVMKAGINIEPPYVDGSMGTRFMIWDVGRQMRNLAKYKNETCICVLGGAGRIGNMVCEDLAREYSKVIAFDSRYKKDEKVYAPNGTITRTANSDNLRQAKLFICLTHHGDVITDFMNHIPADSLIADDTHPCISFEVREQLAAIHIKVKKIVLFHEEFSMWPRMPAWNNRAIPGCLVEALVVQNQQQVDVNDFDNFKQTAQSIGFEGKLIKPLKE